MEVLASPLLAKSVLKFLLKSGSLIGFFRILTDSDFNFESSRLKHLVSSSNLCFQCVTRISSQTEKQLLFYNFLILMNEIFYCNWIWNIEEVCMEVLASLLLAKSLLKFLLKSGSLMGFFIILTESDFNFWQFLIKTLSLEFEFVFSMCN